MRDALTRSVAIALIALSIAVSAGAQSTVSKPAPLTLDAKARGEIIDSLSAQLNRYYVEADTARLIVDHIRKRAQSKAYDADTQPNAFAEHITDDLRAINGDLH